MSGATAAEWRLYLLVVLCFALSLAWIPALVTLPWIALANLLSYATRRDEPQGVLP